MIKNNADIKNQIVSEHDRQETIRTLQIFCQQLKGGYRFQDALAEAKAQTVIKALEKIIAWTKDSP